MRRKILPNNLEIYLTPLVLAHWTMGDGTFDKGRNQRIILCTDCFNLNEVNRLKVALLEKYNISSYIKSSKSGQSKIVHRIAISGKNRKIFQSLVSPYIIPSLFYRIGL